MDQVITSDVSAPAQDPDPASGLSQNGKDERAQRIEELKERIRVISKEHELSLAAYRIKMGELLLSLHRELAVPGYGKFVETVTELGFKVQTAYRYMNAASKENNCDERFSGSSARKPKLNKDAQKLVADLRNVLLNPTDPNSASTLRTIMEAATKLINLPPAALVTKAA